MFFYNFDLRLICACVSLGYLLDLATPDYMLLLMKHIIYCCAFVGRAVVFDLVGQLSEIVV